MQRRNGTFVALQNYKQYLLHHESSGDAKSTQTAHCIPSTDSVDDEIDISAQIKTLLRNILKIFNQEATGENRRKLQDIFTEFVSFAPQLDVWQELLPTVHRRSPIPAIFLFLPP